VNAPYQSRKFGSLGLGNLDAYDRGRGDGSHSATLIGSFQVSCGPSPLELIHLCSSVLINGGITGIHTIQHHPQNFTQNTGTVLPSGDGKIPPRATEFENKYPAPQTSPVSGWKISPFFSENFTN